MEFRRIESEVTKKHLRKDVPCSIKTLEPGMIFSATKNHQLWPFGNICITQYFRSGASGLKDYDLIRDSGH